MSFSQRDVCHERIKRSDIRTLGLEIGQPIPICIIIDCRLWICVNMHKLSQPVHYVLK